MNYVLIRHKVAAFPKWKTGCDAHLPARQEAGLREVKLLHETRDVNGVVPLFEATDAAKARAFCDSAGLHAKMEELGVVGPPQITFLTD